MLLKFLFTDVFMNKSKSIIRLTIKENYFLFLSSIFWISVDTCDLLLLPFYRIG